MNRHAALIDMRYLTIFLLFAYTSLWLTFVKGSLLGKSFMVFACLILISLVINRTFDEVK